MEGGEKQWLTERGEKNNGQKGGGRKTMVKRERGEKQWSKGRGGETMVKREEENNGQQNTTHNIKTERPPLKQ